ncbi:hypothetical protein KP728_17650 [Xanthomonas arboricola pv. juglandis]|uniref:hypothetical protein n=1 Tax=Xanthomonas arboricola TaxID=56448 RepID=UPI002019A392|nr:hypothetical protein [Xanthomonas arboricola]UQP97355.1 hypothetical protein KP728_17650 [Xanthomonas arboricola pv. juglandis]UQQ01526.1 hypothetical protein KP727_17195 [Xanthomonas arboricola pv. juglandis]
MTAFPEMGTQFRTPWLRAAVPTWLLLISAATVIDHVTLSRLSEQAEGSAQGAQVAALESRLAGLNEQIEQERRQPAALPQARYETERQALEQRLASIEQAMGERLSADSLLPLEGRLDRMEARLDKARQAAPAQAGPRTPQAAKPQAPESPPFKVLGMELRGGERFVSILPAGVEALSHARLLRAGESEASWLLESIDGRVAVFRNGSQIQRMASPGG